MITGRAIKGAFMRISSMTATGGRALVRMAPKTKMAMDSIHLGKILGNARGTGKVASWGAPTLSAMRHMHTFGGFGERTVSKVAAAGFVSFNKRVGMQADHLGTEGLSLALFRGRHANLI
jgi:hypothetical protein